MGNELVATGGGVIYVSGLRYRYRATVVQTDLPKKDGKQVIDVAFFMPFCNRPSLQMDVPHFSDWDGEWDGYWLHEYEKDDGKSTVPAGWDTLNERGGDVTMQGYDLRRYRGELEDRVRLGAMLKRAVCRWQPTGNADSYSVEASCAIGDVLEDPAVVEYIAQKTDQELLRRADACVQRRQHQIDGLQREMGAPMPVADAATPEETEKPLSETAAEALDVNLSTTDQEIDDAATKYGARCTLRKGK